MKVEHKKDQTGLSAQFFYLETYGEIRRTSTKTAEMGPSASKIGEIPFPSVLAWLPQPILAMASILSDPERLKSLVAEMRDNWGITGVPSNFQFSADGKKLYFLADTSSKGDEIHVANLTEDGTLLF